MRSADLNRDADIPEPNYTLSPVATEISSVDVLHAWESLGDRLTAGAGFETREVSSQSSQDDEWRLSAEWARDI